MTIVLPRYSWAKTQLPPNPDGAERNARVVHDATGREVAVFNHKLKLWTPRMEAEFQAVLAALMNQPEDD